MVCACCVIITCCVTVIIGNDDYCWTILVSGHDADTHKNRKS